MFAVVVRIQIKPGKRDQFIKAMLDDAVGSVDNEPDCLLFNVVQNSEDPDRIHLYEVYKDEDAFERHRQTPHFQRWINTVEDWLVQPPDIATGKHLFPSDEKWIKQA